MKLEDEFTCGNEEVEKAKNTGIMIQSLFFCLFVASGATKTLKGYTGMTIYKLKGHMK